MRGHDLFYYAQRARQERLLAEHAADGRASNAHRLLETNYILKAMELVVSDARGAQPSARRDRSSQRRTFANARPG